MIHPGLHKNPVALDRNRHRLLRLKRDFSDLSRVAELNAFFVTAGEFVEACREYPVVWVHAGEDAAGVKQVAPMALFGITANQNLCIDAGGWRMRYVPMLLRMYPFAVARASGGELVFCYDASWPGFTLTEGEPLFEADGAPTAYTSEMQTQLQHIEADVERTRLVGEKLLQKDLLRAMRFDATLPDGKTVAVDGFLTVDDKRFGELPDADVLELHRAGILGLIHAHQVSLGNIRRLVEWHAQRMATKPA
jgi:SapC